MAITIIVIYKIARMCKIRKFKSANGNYPFYIKLNESVVTN